MPLPHLACTYLDQQKCHFPSSVLVGNLGPFLNHSICCLFPLPTRLWPRFTEKRKALLLVNGGTYLSFSGCEILQYPLRIFLQIICLGASGNCKPIQQIPTISLNGLSLRKLAVNLQAMVAFSYPYSSNIDNGFPSFQFFILNLFLLEYLK